MMRRLALGLLAALAFSAHGEPVAFGLFGDIPYNDWERRELPKLIGEMDGENLAFVVHDGDIKSGGSACSDEVFKDMLAVFQASKHPLVYVPGDNEWTDCHRISNGSHDPLERLARLRELFFPNDLALGRAPLKLERQSADPAFAPYRENVRWQAGGALFVGLNLPGSNNNWAGATWNEGPSAEYLERGHANRAWIASSFALARERKLPGILLIVQANPGFEAAKRGRSPRGYRDFLTQLGDEARRFPGQVVLVHGDTHHHRIDHPLLDGTGKEPLANFTRVETFGSPYFGWIKATVDTTDPRVFRFEARLYNANSP